MSEYESSAKLFVCLSKFLTDSFIGIKVGKVTACIGEIFNNKKKQIMKKFKLKPENCIIVPGNHDLSWNEDAYVWKHKHKIDNENLEQELMAFEQGEGFLIRDEERYPNRFKNFSRYLYQPLIQSPYPLKFEEQCMHHTFKESS